MFCPICASLERALKNRNSEYINARSSTYCRFSTRFEAYSNVELQRAKSELEMHHSVCVYAVTPAWQTSSV